jgi:pyridoxamine 5'-phosphate oxidase
LSEHRDPIAWYGEWYDEAKGSEPSDANAAALATVDASGAPSVRMVLIKSFDAQGFVFYTNLGSRKAQHLRVNPRAALSLHWKSLRRQVRIEGDVEPVSEAEADEYFASRPRGSQLGAWASRQSEAMEGEWRLEQEVARYTIKFGLSTIPRPPFWGGYRVRPSRFEFWQDMTHRLHRRWEFLPTPDGWARRQLFP